MLYTDWQVVFLGMGISSPLIGLVGDKYGRKVVSAVFYSFWGFGGSSLSATHKASSVTTHQSSSVTTHTYRICNHDTSLGERG